ncbi:DNA adenine methylase [Paraburkholderia sartisoli]|uniref:site-specific DNA-methyltransferase (adenine-specific) n=1 Tax=Paraburkholderia sartisoli TaxID=83784 RepID=A0A1H4CH80_9BURK|nr:DNA adenine methylase [Paraburkholderia sartisoli]
MIMAIPVAPWTGGKRPLADIVVPRFAAHSCYGEVFAGAAALFFMRLPAEVEVLNDVNDGFIELCRVVQRHLEEFIRQFRWALSSRQVFRWLGDMPSHTLADIQRAARFCYLQQNCFGGRVKGRTFGTTTGRRASADATVCIPSFSSPVLLEDGGLRRAILS